LKKLKPFKKLCAKTFINELSSNTPMQPKPTPLPYWLFFIVGGLISGYSSFIMVKGEESNVPAMKFFFYIGLLFILIGIIKALIKFFSKNEENFANNISGVSRINAVEKRILGTNNTNKYNPKTISTTQTNPNTYIYCSQCGNRCFSDSIYCSRCGTRLRR
jgi:amino acid transporter